MDTPTDEHDLQTPATDRKSCATSALSSLSRVSGLQRRPVAAATGTPKDPLKAAFDQAQKDAYECGSRQLCRYLSKVLARVANPTNTGDNQFDIRMHRDLTNTRSTRPTLQPWSKRQTKFNNAWITKVVRKENVGVQVHFNVMWDSTDTRTNEQCRPKGSIASFDLPLSELLKRSETLTGFIKMKKLPRGQIKRCLTRATSSDGQHGQLKQLQNGSGRKFSRISRMNKQQAAGS